VIEMASVVKWIKICTDIFDDEKIALIESMPEADGIIVVWFKLLCMAGKQNNGGVFMMNDKIAYTDEMLATIFRRPLNTVRLALKTFEQFGMIEVVNNAYTIPNWEKHQNLDKMEQAKEQTRQRVAKHREKQKLLAECNGYSNVTVTQCNADRIEEDKDKEEDSRLDNKKKTRRKYGEYNNVLLSDEDMEKLQSEFPDWQERIERLSAYIASTGKSYKNHLATIRNWARNDKPKGRKEIVPSWCESSLDSQGLEEQLLHYRPKFKKTAADDDGIRAKAEALRKELGG
jgi:predicted phage replisome organizer